jgi:hypothetical protein
MYYEIEGQLSIQPLIFDETELIANGRHYPYEEIESLEITTAPLFSTYGILTVRTQGKNIAVPFVRSKRQKLERVLKEYERLKAKGELIPGTGSQEHTAAADAPAPAGSGKALDPYEELKKLKELLDLDIVTKEEFETKKKQLLDL